MRQRSAYEPLLYAILIGFGLLAGLFWNRFVHKEMLNADTKIEQVMGLVQSEYVDSISTDEVEEKAITEMLSSFDPHSVYIPSQYVEMANQDLKDGFDGIGIEFFVYNDTPYVVRVLSGGSAERAKIRPGDRILKVDTISLIGHNNREIIAAIKGKKNSSFIARIYRKAENQYLDIEIKRARVKTPSVYSALLNESTLYVKIAHFAEKTHKEFVEQVNNLKTDQVKNLVLDLRNNPGGYLQTAVELLDEFVDGRDLLAYTKSKAKRERRYNATPGGLCEDLKVVCLVNGRSASASEIVSGALQDLDRATVIGSQTYGKGLVQETFQLRDGSQIRLTVSRYYIPSGRSIQKPYDEKGYQKLDSVDLAKVSKDFRTKQGRLVTSLGGITPDIVMELPRSNSYVYVGTTAAELIDLYQPEWVVMDVTEWLSSDQIDQQIVTQLADSSHLVKRLKMRLIYQLFGMDEERKYGFDSDDVLNKALDELKNPTVLLVQP